MGRDTLTDQLRERMEQEILSGDLPPGSRLDEVSLSERFNVSRTPVREALRQLAANELVVIRPRQTPIVATMTVKTILQMFEVMAELEGLCARLAARRITADALNRLANIQASLHEALEQREVARFYKFNNEFHEVIYLAAANDFLASQTIALRNRLSPYRRHVTQQPGRMSKSLSEHQAVLEAMLSNNSEEAGRLMRNHVALLGDSMTDFVSSLLKSLVQ